ncbi:MAG: mycofactocin biosynthesis glycosyltransferase MftF [Aeromicrobium sp.]|uniref:mycofactocin biosynthesis glycosyltransferase MftF n=1 Tax=Aeromicrobium sp. TaxID=1871063 RepID=UPI00261E2B6A|nr:mycofactocin biosynthesis glycosyltransferase MftF [Aeromicrobium sp.]MDF1706138.1 mycofactocin biosynthesis glycosyltransferase MftF [Aeromicrobium sp.]
MTADSERLPDGFTVRLHDDVRLGAGLSRGARVMRVDPAVRTHLLDRSVVVSSELTSRIGSLLLDLDLAVPVLDGTGRGNLDDVTVVIPVRDRPDGVDRLLGVLADSVSCLVVDDDSRDPMVLAAVAAKHGAELVRLEENVGPAAARNVGLRHVATPLVAFVDSDVMVTPADLRVLMRHFDDPGLAAIAPRVRTPAGTRWFQHYERAEGGLDLGPVPATVRTWSAVAYVPSACLVARVDMLGDGFDEAMRSGEDVDLVWRLVAAGRRVRYEPAVVVDHDQRSTALAWAERQFFYGTSAAPLADRHGVIAAPAVLTVAQALFLASLPITRGRRRWVSIVLAGLVGADAWRNGAGLPWRVRSRVVRSVLEMTLRQGSGLVVHHAAPVSVVAAVLSPRARRVVVGVGVAEAVRAWASSDRSLDPVTYALARRLSTAAYGCGVWSGSRRARSWRSVVPHVVVRGTGAPR